MKRIVIKIGTNLLTNNDYTLNRELISRITEEVSKLHKEIGETGEEVVRVRKEILYFTPTEDTISDEHKVILGKVLSICKENPDFSIKIEGHNDIRESNKIARTRTENVKKALIASGIKEEKITIKWYGSSKPISTAITAEGLARNRRVELILWGKESIKQ